MPLHERARAVMAQIAAALPKPFSEMTVAEARRTFDLFALLNPEKTAVARIENRCIPGPAGEIPIRLFAGTEGGPLPVLVYYHGGGWYLGSLDLYDSICRSLAAETQALVVSVDYRLAPEHRFPAAVEDAEAAARWVADHAVEIGADPKRIAVGGDSAGGNLAAVVAQLFRDRGGPRLVHQTLVYPVAAANTDYLSMSPEHDALLTRASTIVIWERYLLAKEIGANPLASPLYAKSLAGLPPATVITCEVDPLRDEGEAYARRMAESGVPVLHRRYDGVMHGFFTMSGLEEAHAAVSLAARELRKAFAN